MPKGKRIHPRCFHQSEDACTHFVLWYHGNGPEYGRRLFSRYYRTIYRGGGNCQVSTTIYNVAKKVKGIKITERHEHGKEVGYVKKGDDATVAYNSLDLKFKNNTDSDLKLLVEVTNNKVIAKILKIEY